MCLLMWCLLLEDAIDRSEVDDFWSVWSKNAEAGLFDAYRRAGGPTAAGSHAFLARGLLRIRSRRLGDRRLMRLLHSLSTLLLLLLSSFVGVLSL